MRPTPSITCIVARRAVHGGNWIFGMTTRLLQTTSSALAVVASLFMISCSDTASAPQSRGSAPLRQFRLDARPTNIAQLIEISLGEVVAGSVVDATVRVTNHLGSPLLAEQTKPSCSCTTLKLSGDIAPNATGDIQVSIHIDGAHRNLNTSVLVPTADGRVVKLLFVATVPGIRRLVGWASPLETEDSKWRIHVLAITDFEELPDQITAIARWEDGSSRSCTPNAAIRVRGGGDEPTIWLNEYSVDRPMVEGGGLGGNLLVTAEGWSSAVIWFNRGLNIQRSVLERQMK
jgi:hypothetical protein